MARVLLALALGATGASGFAAPASQGATTLTRVDAKSKSMPFLDTPAALDGSMPGDVGFDPLRFTDLTWNMAELLVPAMATANEGALSPGKFGGSKSEGVSMVYWMREAELKHGRLCMLAIVGTIAVDMGIHFPGAKYAGLSALQAHDAMVTSGNMGFMLVGVFALELTSMVAVVQAANGSDRAPGDFAWDPLSLTAKPDSKTFLLESEITHARLAMLAFSGLITQCALYGNGFPYVA
jgi:hypothetical protein